MAFIAAINPKSYFTQPYFGAVCWLIMAWWFYNVNPLQMIRPRNSTTPILDSWQSPMVPNSQVALLGTRLQFCAHVLFLFHFARARAH